MSPTDQRTNSQFEHDYAGLDSSTVVLAKSTALSSGLIDLRLGLVAHESRSSGPQTSLFCTHWIVDPEDSTVQRLDAALVRTVGGTVPAGQVADELTGNLRVDAASLGLARRPFGSPRSTAARRWRFPRRPVGPSVLLASTAARRWRFPRRPAGPSVLLARLRLVAGASLAAPRALRESAVPRSGLR